MSSLQLDNLPLEIFELITQYLSLKECVRLERVNSEWRNAMRKEWRRLKIVDFKQPLFATINAMLIKNSNGASCVDSATVCLQELAVKIHSYVQNLEVQYNVDHDSRPILAFLKKLSQLPTPKLTMLTLERTGESSDENVAEIMADVAQSIPLTLESLSLLCWKNKGNGFKYFCDGFSKQTFAQLKSLHMHHSGYSGFRMNALKTPKLKELTLEVHLKTNEIVFDIDNLDQLTTLEMLSLQTVSPMTIKTGFSKILETATSNDSKSHQTLKQLYLCYSPCYSEQLLSRLGRLNALQLLQLPAMEEIDKEGQLKILRSIGRGCSNLKSLYLRDKVEDQVLIEVADGFHKLSFLYIDTSSVQQMKIFIHRLSEHRCMEINCDCSPTEEEVQVSGILNSHPNIRYQQKFNDYCP